MSCISNSQMLGSVARSLAIMISVIVVSSNMTCCVQTYCKSQLTLEREKSTRTIMAIKQGATVVLKDGTMNIIGKQPECPTPAECPATGHMPPPAPPAANKSLLKPEA